MSSTQQEIKFKELQEQNRKVSESAIKVNAQIENAQENHKKIQAAAVAKFGTSNVEEIKALLNKWETQNASSLQEYEEKINSLSKEVEQKTQIIRQIQQS